MITYNNYSAETDGTVVTPKAMSVYEQASTFNDSFTYENETGANTYIRDLIGTDVRGKPVLPQGENVPGTVTWQLDTGAAITPHKNVITYSFLDSAHTTGMYNRPQEGFPEGFGFSPFTAAQRDATRVAMQTWDDFIAPTIKEVNGSGNADITLANTTTGPAQAWAYVPYDYAEIYTQYGPQYNSFHRYDKFVGDVWIADPRVNSSNGQLDPGFYGLLTLEHEIGHSLGLNHPGEYNYSDDNDGDGKPDPITYEGDAFYFQDSLQYTIMSYFSAYETGAQPVDWNVMRYVYASTPMVDDIAVIQQKYGADMTTRTGDTTYGFNATADVKNAAMRFEKGEMATIFTIWDAAGKDTLDLSGFYTNSVIDLREGAYSSAGGYGAYDASLIGTDPTLAQINANNAAAGLGARSGLLYDIYFKGNVQIPGQPAGTFYNGGESWYEITGSTPELLMQQNIGIAYGAVIENGIGGHGNDRLNGNQADNMLTGNDGNDVFIFFDDGSVDTIADFHSGQDQIDLTEMTVNGWEFKDGSLWVDTGGDSAYDVQIVVMGDAVLGTDLII